MAIKLPVLMQHPKITVQEVAETRQQYVQMVWDGWSVVGAAPNPEPTLREQVDKLQKTVEQAGVGTVADGAVTTGKLASNAVTTGKLAGKAVTTEKLADGVTDSVVQWVIDAIGAGKIPIPSGGDTSAGGGLSTMNSFTGSRVPTVTKFAGNPIATRAQVGLTTIYTPQLLRVPDEVYAANPTLGRLRIYTSTDHDSSSGGIGMFYTDSRSPDAPGIRWSFWRHPVGGGTKLFTEGTNGQVETPCIIWNPLTKLFHMYYQRQSTVSGSTLQTTRVATSPDGISWTPVMDALGNPLNTLAGFDHTGYAKVFYLDGLWVAISNVGSGTTVTSQAIWYSYDGFRFIRDPKMIRGSLQYTDGTLRTAITGLFRYRGELWATGNAAVFKSGIAISTINQPWLAPAADNLRELRGRPQYVPFAASGTETADPGFPAFWAEMEDGRLWGAYRINGPTGSYGLAVMA